MAKKIGFKSYCWAIGTTSYRTDNFNLSIEKQLHLLRQFREIEENKKTRRKDRQSLLLGGCCCGVILGVASSLQ